MMWTLILLSHGPCVDVSKTAVKIVERLFVYESILSKFLDVIVPKVHALRQGVPNDVCDNTANVDWSYDYACSA